MPEEGTCQRHILVALHFYRLAALRVQMRRNAIKSKGVGGVILTLCISSRSTCISSHRDRLLELLHVLQVLDGPLDFPAVDGLGGFTGVLE